MLSIENIYLNKHGTATAKQFIKFQKRQGQAVQTFISSDKGILTGLTSVQSKSGGIPLFKIY